MRNHRISTLRNFVLASAVLALGASAGAAGVDVSSLTNAMNAVGGKVGGGLLKGLGGTGCAVVNAVNCSAKVNEVLLSPLSCSDPRVSEPVVKADGTRDTTFNPSKMDAILKQIQANRTQVQSDVDNLALLKSNIQSCLDESEKKFATATDTMIQNFKNFLTARQKDITDTQDFMAQCDKQEADIQRRLGTPPGSDGNGGSGLLGMLGQTSNAIKQAEGQLSAIRDLSDNLTKFQTNMAQTTKALETSRIATCFTSTDQVTSDCDYTSGPQTPFSGVVCRWYKEAIKKHSPGGNAGSIGSDVKQQIQYAALQLQNQMNLAVKKIPTLTALPDVPDVRGMDMKAQADAWAAYFKRIDDASSGISLSDSLLSSSMQTYFNNPVFTKWNDSPASLISYELQQCQSSAKSMSNVRKDVDRQNQQIQTQLKTVADQLNSSLYQIAQQQASMLTTFRNAGTQNVKATPIDQNAVKKCSSVSVTQKVGCFQDVVNNFKNILDGGGAVAAINLKIAGGNYSTPSQALTDLLTNPNFKSPNPLCTAESPSCKGLNDCVNELIKRRDELPNKKASIKTYVDNYPQQVKAKVDAEAKRVGMILQAENDKMRKMVAQINGKLESCGSENKVKLSDMAGENAKASPGSLSVPEDPMKLIAAQMTPRMFDLHEGSTGESVSAATSGESKKKDDLARVDDALKTNTALMATCRAEAVTSAKTKLTNECDALNQTIEKFHNDYCNVTFTPAAGATGETKYGMLCDTQSSTVPLREIASYVQSSGANAQAACAETLAANAIESLNSGVIGKCGSMTAQEHAQGGNCEAYARNIQLKYQSVMDARKGYDKVRSAN